jgi:hypothetical protein
VDEALMAQYEQALKQVTFNRICTLYSNFPSQAEGVPLPEDDDDQENL